VSTATLPPEKAVKAAGSGAKRNFRTLFPEPNDPLQDHPLVGHGTPVAVPGMSLIHENARHVPAPSADHEKNLTPWKGLWKDCDKIPEEEKQKLKAKRLRHVAAQHDAEVEHQKMHTNARRVRGKHAKGEVTRMGSAPRLDGPVEVTAQPRPVAHVAIEEGASRWLEDALDPKKRQKPDQILEDRRKIKGIDDKPWKKTQSARTARTARSEEARVQRQSDQISNVLNQVIAGRRQLYGKMMSSAETVFKTIDTDNSGSLDRQEFTTAMHRLGLGVSAKQLKQLFKVMDTDGDGQIDCKEFVTALDNAQKRAHLYRAACAPAMPRTAWVPKEEEPMPGGDDKASVCAHLYGQSLEAPADVFCDARAVVVELLDHGADGLRASSTGQTALCKAAEGKSWGFARELISRLGAEELKVFAAEQRLAFARFELTVFKGRRPAWARQPLLGRITAYLEEIGEASQVMSVGASLTLTTRSLQRLPDWVAERRRQEGVEAPDSDAGSHRAIEVEGSVPRYMQMTTAVKQYCRFDPWRHTAQEESVSEASYEEGLLGRRFTVESDGQKLHPLKSGAQLEFCILPSVCLPCLTGADNSA